MPFTRSRYQRGRRRLRRIDARLLAAGEGAVGGRLGAVDRGVVGTRQPADVVEDDDDVGDLVEIGRRQQVGGLDDGVRVVLDVGDHADDEVLRVWRADPAGQLETGRQDLLTRGDLVGRGDVLHDQRPAELADDVPARETRLGLADDRRAAVADQGHDRERRADVRHAADERATGRHDDVADRETVVRALRDRHRAPRLARLAGDDLGRGRLVVQRAPELKERRVVLVLLLDRL